MASAFAHGARRFAARCLALAPPACAAALAASACSASPSAAAGAPSHAPVAAVLTSGECCGAALPGQAIGDVSALSATAHDAPRPIPLRERKERVAHVIRQLSSIVSEGQLVTTDVELEPYGRDWHSYHSGVPPDVVVFPTSTAQVSAVLCACNDAGFPVVARGAGTSLEGHTTTPYRGVCVDLSHMDAVVSVRPDDMDATVQAGVRWQDFNKALAPHGLFFAMDPGPGATLGGMAGTGCSGTNAVRYGAMKANVLSLTVVLADGTVVRTGSRARKSTAGYDLTSLFVGSEGTLGVVTELTVKLQHLPQQTAVAVAAFPHIRAASDAVLATMRSGVHMGAVELLDTNMIGAVNAQSGFAYPATPHVFFKFTGSPAKVADDAARVQACIRAHGGLDFQWTPDQAAQERLWEARKVALWSAGAMDTSRKVATTDVCVPLSRLPDLMAAMEERAAASPLRVYAVGHVGDGNVHHFIAFDPDDAGELREAKALNDFLVATAQGMDGTCTGEHGVGVGKVKYLEAEFGGAALDVMRSVKAALDPRGTLNPGKKLPGCAVPVAADAAAGAPHW